MRRVVFRQAANPLPVESAESYFLVEYDFKNAKDPKRITFYNKLRALLQGDIREFSSTKSVIEINSRELALKIRELAIEHGAIAFVREARTIA